MSILSCLRFELTRIGGGSLSADKLGGGSLSMTRLGGGSLSFGLVCSVGLDDYILWGREGIVWNVYGNKIYLTKK